MNSNIYKGTTTLNSTQEDMIGKVSILLQMTMGPTVRFYLQFLSTCHLAGASTLDKLEKLLGGRRQCCGSGIRCLFDPWIRDA
jgi:hypothetical protein